MRKLLFFIFIFSISYCVSAQKAEPVDAIRLVFDSLEHHFGTVAQGTVVTYEFHFTNKGREPFRFTEGHTSTSAAVVEYPQDLIVPGASGRIRYQFNTNGKMGRQEKSITLSVNCGMKDTVIILRINGNVIASPLYPVMTFDSTTIHYGKIKRGTDVIVKFHFTNTGESDLVITTVMASDGGGFPKLIRRNLSSPDIVELLFIAR